MFPVSCSSFYSSTFVCLVARVAAPGTPGARRGSVGEPPGPGKRPFGAHRVDFSAFLVDWKAAKKSSFFRIASKRQKSTNRSTLGGFRSTFRSQIVDFDVILASIFRHIFEHRFCVDSLTFLCDFQKDPIFKSSVFTADVSQKSCFCKLKFQHVLHRRKRQKNTVF